VTSSTPAEQPAVIGVVGAPRSGSTVLGAIAARRTGGFHVGELHLLWDRLAGHRLCGCGAEVAQCPFWTEVWAQVRGTADVDTPQQACDLWAEAVRMRRAFTGGGTAASRFRALMDATYRSVARISGADTIIDSSKHPGYFRTMAEASTPIRLVHLTRDPRALAFSWSVAKPDPDQPGGAMATRQPAVVAAEWVGLNLLAGQACRRYPDARRVRYEHMVEHGIDQTIALPTPTGATSAGADDQSWNHTVAGNPLRMTSQADEELRLDRRWEQGLGRRDQAMVVAITGPMLAAYGYRLRRSTG
jgi:hypothetical protein